MSGPTTKAPVLSGPLGELQRRGHGGAAVRLVLEWGGTNRFVPAAPKEGSAVVGIIGLAAARVLAEIVYGGKDGDSKSEYIDIPSRRALEPSLKGEILRAEGTTRQIATKLGCTERHVRGTLNGGAGGRKKRQRPQDPRQCAMF